MIFSEKILSGKPVMLSEQHLPIDLPMQQAIDAILNCTYHRGLKKMFMLSKAIEILVLQAEAFDHLQPVKKTIARTDYDKDRIHYAREYVTQHIDTPPNLSELARVVGLNEYKLKHGFKEMFRTTVFGYLAEKRLELARDYLCDPNKSLTEIADLLGIRLSSISAMRLRRSLGIRLDLHDSSRGRLEISCVVKQVESVR